MKRKPTDEQFDAMVAREPLNRRERRLVKYHREQLKDVVTNKHYMLLQGNQGTYSTQYTRKSSE